MKPIVTRSLGGTRPLRPSTAAGTIEGARTAAPTAAVVRRKKRRRERTRDVFMVERRIVSGRRLSSGKGARGEWETTTQSSPIRFCATLRINDNQLIVISSVGAPNNSHNSLFL